MQRRILIGKWLYTQVRTEHLPLSTDYWFQSIDLSSNFTFLLCAHSVFCPLFKQGFFDDQFPPLKRFRPAHLSSSGADDDEEDDE